MKVLSLIVPAYNSEQYLDKCITSFLHKDVLSELEVIIVNDGSKDNTEQIAEKYSELYPDTVKVISQENKGHGGALNTGCAAATGKYLKVIDADDWVETKNLPRFIDLLKSNDSDVVLTHHYTVNISTGEIKKWRSYPEIFGKAYGFEDIMSSWKSFDRSLTFHGITYNTEFYHKHGIKLSEHVFYEDHEFATFPACFAKTVTPFDLFIYHYRIGDVSQSVSEENQVKRLGHTETVIRRLVDESKEHTNLMGEAGKQYCAMKTQGLLLSYFTTALLCERNKKKGRKMSEGMMKHIRDEMPETYTAAVKQYKVFRLLNALYINKKTWDRIIASKIYNRLRGNHDFK